MDVDVVVDVNVQALLAFDGSRALVIKIEAAIKFWQLSALAVSVSVSLEQSS